MKERFNRIDLIDWDSVEMEPMQPSECQGEAPEYGSHANKRASVVGLIKAFRFTVRLLIVFGFIILLYVGALIFKGEIDAPELMYHEVIGLLFIVVLLELYQLIGRKL